MACQRAKVTKQPRSPVQAIPIPSKRFSNVHVDLVGPFTASEDGFMYLITMVDRTTRWLEAVPLKSITVSSCVEVFFSSWIACFGVPKTIVSDRGTQFSSASWAAFCSNLGIKHTMMTSYHLQANGLIERTHRQLKDALHARGAGMDWLAHLHWALLGLEQPRRRSVEYLPLRLSLASLWCYRGNWPPVRCTLREEAVVLHRRQPMQGCIKWFGQEVNILWLRSKAGRSWLVWTG